MDTSEPEHSPNAPQPGELWRYRKHEQGPAVFWLGDRCNASFIEANENAGIIMIVSAERKGIWLNGISAIKWDVQVLVRGKVAFRTYDDLRGWHRDFKKVEQ